MNPLPLPSSPPIPLGTAQLPLPDTPASAALSVPSTVSSPISTRPHYPHIRSCLSCRHRKVKCDRQYPCSNCDRTGTECIFPPGPGRAPKKPRGTRDPRLLERLWKLEDIVCRLGAELDPEDHPTENGSKIDSVDPVNAVEQEFGRLLIDETDDPKSSYLCHRLWVRFGDVVEELRDNLLDPSSNDEEDESEGETTLSDQNVGLDLSLQGYRALSHSLHCFHPPLPHLMVLLDVFKENVSPLVRIFHMPSMTQMFWGAISSLDFLTKSTEALMFSIYYAAVISLAPEECQSLLGESRSNLLTKYRFAVEQALARAGLLTTQSVVLIQAAVLFLSASRNEDGTRAVWSMTALVFHLAQALGLHRDGTSFNLKPFETEIRRRIWWHICLLDARSSEDHGCEPIVHDAVFDTRPPLNVNDSDLWPGMAEFPQEKEEATEMIFCLIRCQVTRTVRKIGYVPARMRCTGREIPTRESRTILMGELQRLLEERYLRHCDPSVPLSLAAETVARLIIARMSLAVHHPMSQEDPIPSNIRDQLFLTSIEIVKLSTLLLVNEALLKWKWYFKTHIQWHAIGFVLSEICTRPPSPECDRAWEYVTIIIDHWKPANKELRGTHASQVRKLLVKARQIREMQQNNNFNGQWIAPPEYIPEDSSEFTYPYSMLPFAAADGVTGISPVSVPRDPLFGGIDSFMWDADVPSGLPSTQFNPLTFDADIFPPLPLKQEE